MLDSFASIDPGPRLLKLGLKIFFREMRNRVVRQDFFCDVIRISELNNLLDYITKYRNSLQNVKY